MSTVRTESKSKLDEEIDRLLSNMSEKDASTLEYSKMADQLVKLYSLKPKSKRVSADTLAVVLGNLVVTAIIVGYERAHIMTTRAGNFTLKTPV